MSDPYVEEVKTMAKPNEFLFCPPGALSVEQRATVEAAGVIVVESKDWWRLKIVRADCALPSNDMLALAGAAILVSEVAAKVFGQSVATALIDQNNDVKIR